MYRAQRDADGRYTIFDVEIFLPYEDESKYPPKMTTEDLQNLANVQLEEKENAQKKYGKDKNFLPRTHASHHEPGGQENKPGAGYLDNLRVENDILFADMVRIPEEIFQQIANGRFPYRSVELGDTPEGKIKISTMALLESREPYHSVPMMDSVHFQKTQKITIFQNLRNLVDVQKVKKKEKSMDMSKYAEAMGCSEEEAKEMYMAYMSDKMGGEMDEEFMQYMKDAQESGGDDDDDDDDYNGAGMETFQKEVRSNFQKLFGMVNELKAKEASKGIESELEQVCAEKGLNFQKEKKTISLFQKEEQKLEYISILREQPNKTTKKPDGSFQADKTRKPRDYSPTTTTTIPMTTSVAERFQKEPRTIQELSVKLGNAYDLAMKSASKKDKRLFQKAWPDREGYVDYHVKKEKKQPGYCEVNRIFAKG